MNNMNKQQLFAFITEVSFALDDISLYLDTHPECPKALAAYSNYKAMRQQAVREYTTAYGPLNRYQVNDDNYFDWVDQKTTRPALGLRLRISKISLISSGVCWFG